VAERAAGLSFGFLNSTSNPSLTVSTPGISVVTADGARQLDARTIATLTDSHALMRRAAMAAVAWLSAREERSAAVYVGSGNNGGDGWLIAGLLRDLGWNVTVYAAGAPRTPDAQRAREEAERAGMFAPPTGSEALVLDALLGTGSSGAPRGDVAEAMRTMRDALRDGSTVIAIDIPSALDATTGEDSGAVAAAHTLTFGSVKRGQLLRRDLVGELHVLDIGVVDAPPNEPRLLTCRNVADWLPTFATDAYKGTRGRVAIVGGGVGMAGAAIIVARGAHASGAGMLRADVARESVHALQIAVPFATARAHDAADWSTVDTKWPECMVIGPGLDGRDAGLRERVLALLYAFPGPVVLDAGALTAFHARDEPDAENIEDSEGGMNAPLEALRHALRGRQALLTPHIGEFSGLWPSSSPIARFDAPSQLARALNATVLLKGVPTIIAAPDGSRLVSATGNPALAMGGTGDLLSGIAGTLLAQGMPALHAGAAAAWVHGTAAELAVQEHGSWRGVTMDRLLDALSRVWPRLFFDTTLAPPTIAHLPAVPTR
jgi:ADP-dependent NAD(P)H-hydrate dehydratase / NAD(P)H-hydrate epimerase